MAYGFRWNDWNLGHIADHGVSADEAEHVVNHAKPPYPRKAGEGRYLAVGRTARGDYVQVVYVLDSAETVFVIHARPLTQREKRRWRRRRRR